MPSRCTLPYVSNWESDWFSEAQYPALNHVIAKNYFHYDCDTAASVSLDFIAHSSFPQGIVFVPPSYLQNLLKLTSHSFYWFWWSAFPITQIFSGSCLSHATYTCLRCCQSKTLERRALIFADITVIQNYKRGTHSLFSSIPFIQGIYLYTYPAFLIRYRSPRVRSSWSFPA